MSSLTVLGYGKIRITEDGRYSVYDTIRVVGGKKNPRDAWDSLCEQYTEIVGKTDSYRFPGARGPMTPVATTENTLYIIGLLPGAVGRSYREDAARQMIAKLEGQTNATVVAEPVTLQPAPKEIAEAIASVFCLGTIDPNLIQGLITSYCFATIY